MTVTTRIINDYYMFRIGDCELNLHFATGMLGGGFTSNEFMSLIPFFGVIKQYSNVSYVWSHKLDPLLFSLYIPSNIFPKQMLSILPSKILVLLVFARLVSYSIRCCFDFQIPVEDLIQFRRFAYFFRWVAKNHQLEKLKLSYPIQTISPNKLSITISAVGI